MSSSVIRYLNPWKAKRERQAARVKALRQRDGDACARCRRPLRFDLPAGHDQGFKLEEVVQGGGEEIDNLRLCHPRCNAAGKDHTEEVLARARVKKEAALFAKSRKRRKQAA